MSNLFNTILYQPLFNSLVGLVLLMPGHDLGFAIITLTLIIRIALYPLSAKSIKSQRALQTLQPKLKEIQDKYKDNKEEQQKKIMEFYKTNKINPLSSCLPMLVQFPILLALYRVFMKGLHSDQFSNLYRTIPAPENFNTVFLGLVDLNNPSAVLAVLTGLSQYWQTRIMLKMNPKKKNNNKDEKKKSSAPDFSQMMSKQMLYFMPLFITFIAWRLPSGLALYWIASTVFTIIQQYILIKKNPVKSPEAPVNSVN